MQDLHKVPEGRLNWPKKTARDIGQNFVGTEHILAGLAGEGEGLAAVLLKENGINL